MLQVEERLSADREVAAEEAEEARVAEAEATAAKGRRRPVRPLSRHTLEQETRADASVRSCFAHVRPSSPCVPAQTLLGDLKSRDERD